jgi:hypothetical protein
MMKTFAKIGMALLLGGLPALAHAEDLLAGPYTFSSTQSVLVKPAQLGGGWGLTLGYAVDSVISKTVTAGWEVDADIPVVPYPNQPRQSITLYSTGLRLGAVLWSDALVHGWFNNTVGVGLAGNETYFLDEVSAAAELNVVQNIKIFAGAGDRFTYGINDDRGLTDKGTRGLFFVAGLKYGTY